MGPAAAAWCRQLAEQYAQRRAAHREAPFLTVGELLGRWVDAEHDWKPSTVCGCRSHIRGLGRDEVLDGYRVVTVTPAGVRQAMARWADAGAGPSVVGGRFRTLRSAIGWAYEEGIIDRHPLAAMRGPTRGEPRRHLPTAAIRLLLRTAEERLEKACADDDGGLRSLGRVHAAEQSLLAVRLAADSGARRGELAALQLDDLDGKVLTIARGASMDQIGTTKTRRVNRLTLGATTAALWHSLVSTTPSLSTTPTSPDRSRTCSPTTTWNSAPTTWSCVCSVCCALSIMSEVNSYEIPRPERERLAAVVGDPDRGPISLSTPSGVVQLPKVASAAVRRLLEELAAGTSVHLIADDAVLATSEAGELLGIARTYVTRLVDEGKLPAHRVGSHRRLRAGDVLTYNARRAQRLVAVDAITEGDRAAGVPYR